MKKLALILSLLFSCALWGQQTIGIKAEGGLSKISDKFNDPNLSSENIYLMPSGQAGFFYNLPIRSYEVFGAELLFTQIEGKEKILDTLGPVFYSNIPTKNLLKTTTISRHISYLTLPIHYGIKVKNFTFNIGVRISARLMGSAEETIQRNYGLNSGFFINPSIPSSTYYYSTNRLHIKDVDFGETIGIMYHVIGMFAIEANYYYGFNNIFPNNSQPTVQRIQQMTIGIRYTILPVKKGT